MNSYWFLSQSVEFSVENTFNDLNIFSKTKSVGDFCSLAHPSVIDFNSMEETDKVASFRQYLLVRGMMKGELRVQWIIE